jgi:hypothetical protein
MGPDPLRSLTSHCRFFERRKGQWPRVMGVPVAVRSGEGPLTEHKTATQAQPPERVFMLHCRHPAAPPDGVMGGN